VRRGWVFTLGTPSRHEAVGSSEREEELAEFQNMYSPRSPPPLIDTDKCCLMPPSVSPERELVYLPICLRSGTAPSISTAVDVETR